MALYFGRLLQGTSAEGYRLRLYVPSGQVWRPYYMPRPPGARRTFSSFCGICSGSSLCVHGTLKEEDRSPTVNRVPRWRIVAAAAVLAALAIFGAMFAPIYFRNLQLQSFVAALPQRVENQTKSGPPPSDDVVRTWVLNKAYQLELPVKAGGVQIFRTPEGRVDRVEVRYFVRLDLPGYTVNLHFYPGVGSQ